MQPAKPSPQTNLRCGLVAILICFCLTAALIGLAALLDAHEKAADYQPIPTVTATDPNPNAPVTCNNSPMSPTDQCDHLLSGAKVGTYSYDEQKVYQKQQRIENAQNAINRKNEDLAQQQGQKYKNSFAGNFAAILSFIGGIIGLVGLVLIALTIKEAVAAVQRKRRR
ncbi:hypothetical protein KSD_61510 [Ktedonobacter sp. SOSP1-85]|uniref:hypothetical protein n=1 Tax=Ktedonobacter sp. SOSP1-85 TaxID=2778367 RepID=UPI00191529DB|nr:hypothetical protein [Ktedonobacter sp. SOSP1-85]GHO78380.1 hypothetical protein KSD_61510 [Ktedonobacter sp. SOSP1-85]